MKLTFCGAAQIVTGSNYLLETANQKALVDCGMFQGPKEITKRNYDDFSYDPASIDYVFLTHAHIDHSGLLPKLVRKGFKGKIIATEPTHDLCKIMLEDSAEVQKLQIEHENKRRKEDNLPPREPLYGLGDVTSTINKFQIIEYDELTEFGDFKVRYQDAGHILGAAMIELFAENKKIVFTGDIGEWDSPIVKDPTYIEEADYLVTESTYGNRLHESIDEREELLMRYVNESFKKGGKLMIPSFAVERTQEILYLFKKMARKMPNENIFLDSPLAMKATEIFSQYADFYDEETAALDSPFTPRGLRYTETVQDSKNLNRYAQPCIIMAGSGMCTGGRIRHHLYNSADNPNNTILFVGYQAEGTTGRKIQEGEKVVPMMGHNVSIKADVRSIDGFSAHADYEGLLKWARGFRNRPRTFITHGEPDAAESYKEKMEKEGFECSIPQPLDSVEL